MRPFFFLLSHLDLSQQLRLGHILRVEQGRCVEAAGEGSGGRQDGLQVGAQLRVLRPKVHGGEEGGGPCHRLQLHQVEEVDILQPARALAVGQSGVKPPSKPEFYFILIFLFSSRVKERLRNSPHLENPAYRIYRFAGYAEVRLRQCPF